MEFSQALVRWWPCACTYTGKTSRKIIPLARGNGRGWHEVTGEGRRRPDEVDRQDAKHANTNSNTLKA